MPKHPNGFELTTQRAQIARTARVSRMPDSNRLRPTKLLRVLPLRHCWSYICNLSTNPVKLRIGGRARGARRAGRADGGGVPGAREMREAVPGARGGREAGRPSPAYGRGQESEHERSGGRRVTLWRRGAGGQRQAGRWATRQPSGCRRSGDTDERPSGRGPPYALSTGKPPLLDKPGSVNRVN